jgi:N-acetylglucosaminyldiphosphoundecaprenol N-acetyl-beta-D-mannosaminyltransferase
VFLFGATDDVLGEVVRRVSRQFSPELIAGYRNGYYEPEKEREIAEMIAASGAHILFVAMSSPKKEYFLCRHREVLAPVNFRMGVGGTFDVFAGKVKRAPAWVQRAGMEWLYRFTQEPRDKWKPVLVESLRFVYYLAAQEVRERTRGQ